MSTAAYAPPKAVDGKPVGEEVARVHRIRITLTSRNVANLEKGAPRTSCSCSCRDDYGAPALGDSPLTLCCALQSART
jgi:hypothetical protein